ncbi:MULTISPECIES: ABC transporter ATP-binding protein [unclassified Exiguobacterium]|uniref:ABC transporter ATP-binding protein n=1 Tax=unclassified Exiguobacterium TaxID=2644629 RepID=UPI00103B6A49|nr:MULTISPECIES: ABC transporter ATP-binding protein [unclassified Exiguobacterium]TCI47502.1 ABC transporter ATP-binding protein [Exiguobacterium sp. SH5S32]TCI54385.1 ABC transporter ATP-binding protein [Exiguobacterium sp. SH1S4]TCI65109.1 ABC transporter ATP-binding protein [Exiguobacterium sp. SH0S2]TCI74179.1 ABC transporter ATP-binding protein [Exiguobacterium sp. SH1S1]TCI80476.1 ABC transporter ATP-binding protein [Exiguobacterium sp. SH0S1]
MKLTGIYHAYEQPILSGIDLTVSPGECIGIVGPSGSGKSTLLQILGLLKQPDAGTLYLDTVDVFTLDEEARRKLRLNEIGFVFQDAHLVPYLTVIEQLALIQAESDTDGDAKQLLTDFGLGHRLNELPNRLSGGERQRVAVARALINDPKLLLADEPTASLDYTNGRLVMERLAAAAHERNKRVIVITHDERMLDVCDRVLRLRDGQLETL